MPTNRLEVLQNLLTQNPSDAFVRYGLAMEYKNSGQPEKAMEEFRQVIAANPDYNYAYFHGGQTLEAMGRMEEARDMYEAGVAAAGRTGDGKAMAELQGALDILPL